MDDIDEIVDLSALINVLLPLDFYRQALFPSEQSFDRLRQLIRGHFTRSAMAITPITQEFLFSICDMLLQDIPFAIPIDKIFLAVLRCMKTWRLLPTDEKNLDVAVDRLASNLAGLVNCRAFAEQATNGNGLRLLRVRWIGADSEDVDVRCLDLFKGEITPKSPGVGIGNDVGAQSGPLSSPTHFCSNIPLHETAAFRSGCSCCRKPRISISNQCPSRASIYCIHDKTKEPHQPAFRIKSFVSITSQDTSKPGSTFVDENVPPAPSSKKLYRSVLTPGSKSRTIPNATLTNNVVPPMSPLSRSKPIRPRTFGLHNPTRIINSHTQSLSRSSSARASSSDSQARMSAPSTKRPSKPKSVMKSSSSRTSIPTTQACTGVSKQTPVDDAKKMPPSTRLKVVIPAPARVLKSRKGQM